MKRYDLAGQWQFKEDPQRIGVAEKWYLAEFENRIQIPGTMEENGYGEVPRVPYTNDLNHTYAYSGWAWYRTEFELTEADVQQNVFLFLERIQWDSFVWIDGIYIGNLNSLSVPHEYPLKELQAGRHVLTVMLDNSNMNTDAQLPELPEDTETDEEGRKLTLHLHTVDDGSKKIACGCHGDMYSFNGIVGEALILVKPQVYIERTEIHPDIHKQTVLVKVHVKNPYGKTGSAGLKVQCEEYTAAQDMELTGDIKQIAELTLDFRGTMHLWDEFDPYVYTFTVELQAAEQQDTDTVQCGLRELRREGRHIFLNDERLFFRATLEGAAFPYTGYHPTDEAFWLRAYTILKSYGLNGMRMHTFIPPKAAFDAAEKVGFYLQIELPGTSCPEADEAQEVCDYLWSELRQGLKQYGNYACFLFMSMGNEQLISWNKEFVARHQKVLMEKVEYAQKTDPRHLYTCTSHNHTDGRNDDFYLVARKDELVLNGIAWGGPDPITTSRFCLEKPSTKVNFQEGVLRMDRPSITHEVGQWAVYPNFAEMHKYTGVLKPRNYEVFARQLDQNGLLHQNESFVKNSGQLSLLLYKEEIESALRTPDLSGFELLDIHDYPGQGTSTVGILDCFFDSKGLITPEEYRRFCAPVVTLCAFDRFVYRAGEELEVTPMVANYSKEHAEGTACLRLLGEDGAILHEVSWDAQAPKGRLTEYPVQKMLLQTQEAAAVTLYFELAGFSNSWKIWVYPESVPEVDIPVVTDLGTQTQKLLEEGQDVLYIMPHGEEPMNGCQGSFTSQFWNPFMKPQKTKNGILCDPKHPAFAYFPTESYTNYQWWEILMKSYFMSMDMLPKAFFPIVQIIPGIKDNGKHGLIWECKVGTGRVLICTADLLSSEGCPAAGQLLYSLKKYIQSPDFAPQQEIELDRLRDVLR